jgi:hypothetical protein
LLGRLLGLGLWVRLHLWWHLLGQRSHAWWHHHPRRHPLWHAPHGHHLPHLLLHPPLHLLLHLEPDLKLNLVLGSLTPPLLRDPPPHLLHNLPLLHHLPLHHLHLLVDFAAVWVGGDLGRRVVDGLRPVGEGGLGGGR